MYGIDDWLEAAYEDRNGEPDGDDNDDDVMFQDFHDAE
jgi:hypothetical protein